MYDILAKAIHVPNAPKIPWALIGAAILVTIVGAALWKTTIGKVLIVAGAAGVAGFMVANGAFHGS